MYIALIVDDYLPHSTRVAAKMMHELAVSLKNKGYQPIVITPSSIEQDNSLVIEELDGVLIWKFKSKNVKIKNKLKRAVNELLLSFNGWKAIKNESRKIRFSGVIYYSPSIFFGHLVAKLKKQHACKSYLVLRDIFPQWVIDNKIISKYSPVAYFFKYFEKINYKYADTIGLMSEQNLIFFNDLYKQKYNTEVLYNWIALSKDGQSLGQETITADERKIVKFFYGGNIGLAQDIPILLRLAVAMKDIQNVCFVFAGDGDAVHLIGEYIEQYKLTNIEYLGTISQSEYLAILNTMDVGLFSLNFSHKTHNFPGKLLGYMNSRLPILGSVNPDNDLTEIVHKHECGYIIENGSDEDFLNYAKLLLDSEIRKTIGNNGFKLLSEKFSVNSAVDVIMEKL